MKKRADFRQSKILRDLWLSQQSGAISLAHKEEAHELMGKIYPLEQKRHEWNKDHERRTRLEEDYYHLFCAIAEENGAVVELDIDEEYYYGTLTYWGDTLLTDDSFSPNIKQLSEIIADSDTIKISATDSKFHLQLSFDMNIRKTIASPSPELLQLKERLKQIFNTPPRTD